MINVSDAFIGSDIGHIVVPQPKFTVASHVLEFTTPISALSTKKKTKRSHPNPYTCRFNLRSVFIPWKNSQLSRVCIASQGAHTASKKMSSLTC